MKTYEDLQNEFGAQTVIYHTLYEATGFLSRAENDNLQEDIGTVTRGSFLIGRVEQAIDTACEYDMNAELLNTLYGVKQEIKETINAISE